MARGMADEATLPSIYVVLPIFIYILQFIFKIMRFIIVDVAVLCTTKACDMLSSTLGVSEVLLAVRPT